MNTADSTSAMPITGAETSFIAFSVASFGFMPCSMWCITASTTTMASSTTMPMASTRPNIDSVFTLKPSIGKKMNVPISETGTVSSGMSVARQFCRKMKTTSDHEDDRLDERLDDLVDGLLDGRRRVVDDLVVHVRREDVP